MTIDDESSIYVGGIPYDSTEDSLRRIFDIYGDVVAVKIINDQTVGGKCYAFVTFTSPRSAMHAINDMDGQTVDGRVVRVNEVRSRGRRSNFGRDSFRRYSDRGIDVERGRSLERDRDHDGDQYRDDYRERSHERDPKLEIGYDNIRDHDRTRDRLSDRERVRDHDKDLDSVPRNREKMHGHNWERARDMDKEIERTANHKAAEPDKDGISKLFDRSYSNDRGKRDRSLESNYDDDHVEIAKQLESSNYKFQELQKEASRMEELAEEKKLFVLKLQEKFKILEESLTSAKRDTSHRQVQLAKLSKYYQEVQDCNESIKHCEQELQSLVSSTMYELEHGSGMGARDAILTNGSV